MDFIEIARFTYLSEAAVLESILISENIRYFMRNKNSATVYAPAIPVILEVSDEDVSRTVEIVKEAGFECYLTLNNFG
ncbi:MAG: DUF2007 domain-containing protein [Dysgonamonadaceae bacterium]|jgi:hypothetical protein|nr:DUF2007 domain-containing protein [Dysgonamonadaceae bacterium]